MLILVGSKFQTWSTPRLTWKSCNQGHQWTFHIHPADIPSSPCGGEKQIHWATLYSSHHTLKQSSSSGSWTLDSWRVCWADGCKASTVHTSTRLLSPERLEFTSTGMRRTFGPLGRRVSRRRSALCWTAASPFHQLTREARWWARPPPETSSRKAPCSRHQNHSRIQFWNVSPEQKRRSQSKLHLLPSHIEQLKL